jgi:hypothetical protein
MGIICVDFDATGQLLSILFCIRQVLEEIWEYNKAVRLLTEYRKAYASIKREVLCTVVIEFGTAMKLVRLIKMCLNETESG